MPEDLLPEEPQPEPIPNKRFGTGEPVFLYVEVSRGVYDNIGEFPSKVDARHHAESDWKGHRYKTLTANEAVAEQQKLQARQERVQKTVEKIEKGATKLGAGLKRVAKNVGRNAEGEARYHGMIHDRPSAPAQNINVNVNTAPQQPRPSEAEELRKFGKHINRSYNPLAEDFNPPEPPQRKQYMINKPVSKLTFHPPESLIKPSKHALNPPVHSKKQYGVRQQHGSMVFSDNIRPFRIPVHSLYPRRSEPQPVKKVNKKQKKRRKR